MPTIRSDRVTAYRCVRRLLLYTVCAEAENELSYSATDRSYNLWWYMVKFL